MIYNYILLIRMFRIDSYLHPEQDNLIVIKLYNDRIVIMNKLLELNFNDNKDATFAESGYQFEPLLFDNFIQNIEHKISDIFSFDDQDRIDNLEYINDIDKEHIVFRINIELSNMVVMVPINDKNRKDIINDIKALFKLINKTIKDSLEAIEKIENYNLKEK